jgi:hypothetical protein
MLCLNCSKEHIDNFCPNCGEKSAVKRITFKSMMEDFLSSFINMDKGLLFNLKWLTIDPKKIIAGYIKGKRKGILNPISYLLFSISLYLIILVIFDFPKEAVTLKGEPDSDLGKAFYGVGLFIRGHIKYFWILSIIPLGLSLKLVFGKYNFFECFAIACFVVGHATLASILSYFVFKRPLFLDPVVFLFILWLILRVFKNSKFTIEQVLMSITSMIIFIIQLAIILAFMGFIMY